jgi:trehalose 2-sulfotransferase
MPAPHTSYLICSTPRTGSSLLCDALTATGVAGRPEEYFQFRARTGQPRRPQEYFEQAADEEIFAILGPRTRVDADEQRYDPSRFPRYENYLTWAIREGTTPNGVFGAKVMWGYFSGFVTGLRWAIPGRLRLDLCELAPSVFPNLHMLWMTRNDKVAQAVSLWRAIQSWSWSSDQAPDHDGHLRYCYPAIHYLLDDIIAHEAEWQRYFGECGVRPYVVVYEQFRAAYQPTIMGILENLGVDTDGIDIDVPTRRSQTDELSDEWIDRYRQDAATDEPLLARS